jgi:hypothetical protein
MGGINQPEGDAMKITKWLEGSYRIANGTQWASIRKGRTHSGELTSKWYAEIRQADGVLCRHAGIWNTKREAAEEIEAIWGLGPLNGYRLNQPTQETQTMRHGPYTLVRHNWILKETKLFSERFMTRKDRTLRFGKAITGSYDETVIVDRFGEVRKLVAGGTINHIPDWYSRDMELVNELADLNSL